MHEQFQISCVVKLKMHFGYYLLGRSLGPPNDGFDIINDNQFFSRPSLSINQHRHVTQNSSNEQDKCTNVLFYPPCTGRKKHLLFQTSKPIITLEGERSFQKVQTKVLDNAKIKLNDCRLHRAAQIYRTCNWKEMQNERGLALFGHTRFP